MSKARVRDDLNVAGIEKIKTLIDFDDRYTAPLHGFASAVDYYERCSSINFVELIKTPTLIVNAQNDPFLSDKCYPNRQLKGHSFVRFEDPGFGGHVGFSQFTKKWFILVGGARIVIRDNQLTHRTYKYYDISS